MFCARSVYDTIEFAACMYAGNYFVSEIFTDIEDIKEIVIQSTSSKLHAVYSDRSIIKFKSNSDV